MSLTKIVNRTIKSLRKAVCLGIVGAAFLTGNVRAEPEYEITRLSISEPNVNIDYSYPHSINNNGDVIVEYGYFGTGCNAYPHPLGIFLYNSEKEVIRKLNLPADVFTNPAVNDFGNILAESKNTYFSAIYKIDGIIELNFYGRTMNNKEEVIGQYIYNYLYQDGHKIISNMSCIWGINDNTEIVGEKTDKTYAWFPAVWKDGEATILKTPGKAWGRALDINNNSEIVGQIIERTPYAVDSSACMWDKERKFIRLGNKDDTSAYSINDSGQIVGIGREGGYLNRWIAVSWKNRVRINLNDYLSEDSEWERLTEALDINNKGQIIGVGEVKGMANEYAFLMTPIPLEGDLNNDDKVDFKDLAIMANNWLENNTFPSSPRGIGKGLSK